MKAKRFRIVFAVSAKRELTALESEPALQIARDIQGYLESNPIPLGKPRLKKLIGFDPPLYRLRSGDFRIFYRIAEDEVIIVAIRHRKDSKRFIKKIQEPRSTYKKSRLILKKKKIGQAVEKERSLE